MERLKPKCVLNIEAELGEHPLWSVDDACLYWLDIEKSTINRFVPGTGENTHWTLPARPGCFALRAEGGALVAAQDGFYKIDFASGAIERLMPSAHDPAVMRFNDGRTDSQGRLWVSTVRVDMDLTKTLDNAYYRLDARGLERVLHSVGIPNGTAFSPDGKIMYRAQSETRQIHCYDYDTVTGTPSHERLFATISPEYGMPDGAAVDELGGYWIALSAPPSGPPNGGVARFTPDGKWDLYFELPIPFVTMIAFGGPNLSTLYITTARLAAFMPNGVPPGAGNLYAVETGFRGLAEIPFHRT